MADAQNILNNSDHLTTVAQGALVTLGSPALALDQTCATGINCLSGGQVLFVPNSQLVSQSVDSSIQEFLGNSSTSTGTPNSHVPYKILNQSSSGYDVTVDQLLYAALFAHDQTYNWAYCGGPGLGDPYPPVAAMAVLPGNAGPLSSNMCGYALGVEFSLGPGAAGFDTSSPSATTESVSAIIAWLRFNNPTWNAFDTKGALRQTAGNWSTGYAPKTGTNNLGFGQINRAAANAVGSTSNVFLQSPGMKIVNHSYFAGITLYPFRSTRRDHEEIYIGGTWPNASTVNELTPSQVTAAGGTLIYTSNGTDVEPVTIYIPSMSGTANFTALTRDAAGNASRVESFNIVPQSFLVGTACLQ